MLVYSMSTSVDGYIEDRDGGIGWSSPVEELFRFHTEQVRALGAILMGRRLHEAMLVWETDPGMRRTEEDHAFADLWMALPKVVFSRTLTEVEGTARLATAPLADEIAAAVASADGDVEIGGADLAAQALELDLVDEVRLFRHPVVLGGGTPYFPQLERKLPLELVEVRTFGDRVVFERYRRDRG